MPKKPTILKPIGESFDELMDTVLKVEYEQGQFSKKQDNSIKEKQITTKIFAKQGKKKI